MQYIYYLFLSDTVDSYINLCLSVPSLGDLTRLSEIQSHTTDLF